MERLPVPYVHSRSPAARRNSGQEEAEHPSSFAAAMCIYPIIESCRQKESTLQSAPKVVPEAKIQGTDTALSKNPYPLKFSGD